MIKCENGTVGITVEVQGTKSDLLVDVTAIMKGLMEKNILDKEDLEMILTIACMDSKDLENAVRDIRESVALASLIFGDMEDK